MEVRDVYGKKIVLIDENGIRSDGRKWNELRPLRMKVGVLERADGSALVEMGKTKVLVAVYGPREAVPRHSALPDKAMLRVAYRMATFSVEERKKPQPSRREIELSKVIKEALEPAIILEEMPRTVIDVYALVLQADGGTRVTSINAVSLALADAGIPMRGLVAAVAVGRIGNQIIVDLNDVEDKYGDSDLPIAMLLPEEEITLLQMDGTMSPDQFEAALSEAKKVLHEIYEQQKKTLKERYIQIQREVNNGGDKK